MCRFRMKPSRLGRQCHILFLLLGYSCWIHYDRWLIVIAVLSSLYLAIHQPHAVATCTARQHNPVIDLFQYAMPLVYSFCDQEGRLYCQRATVAAHRPGLVITFPPTLLRRVREENILKPRTMRSRPSTENTVQMLQFQG